MKIETMHARPDGRHIVNLGLPSEVAVDPFSDADPNGADAFEWLRSNSAQRWVWPVADWQARAERRMVDWINQLTAQVTSGYSSAEIASWPEKAREAEAILAGGTASALLQAEADLVGQSVEEVAALVKFYADSNAAIVGAVTGIRRTCRAAIYAATTKAGVDAALDAARISAIAAATEFGLSVDGLA